MLASLADRHDKHTELANGNSVVIRLAQDP